MVENRDTAWVPASFVLQWHLTDRCDRQCTHCYQDEGGHGKELDWMQLMEVLGQFRALLGHWRRARCSVPAQITVTGGEPYLREDFPRLLEYMARERGIYSFAVLSNGGQIDRATAFHLARVHPVFVQVSVDGQPERHDQMRGGGDFARVERAIRLLKTAGVKTLVSFTAHPGNAGDFPWVARWAWRLGVDRVWSDRLLPLGAAAQWEKGQFSPLATKDFFVAMRRARDVWWGRVWPRGEVSMQRALQFLVGDGRPYHCTAGDRLLALLPDGTVLPCRRLPLAVGQVWDPGGLRRIYDEQALLRQLRHPEAMPDGCQECFYVRLCRGGLRCLSYAVTGDPFRRDPGCWL
ncbi:MAG: radical SAM protein [Magnetococcus sp. YQC-5]